jgi:hypothetical protein
MFAYRVNEGYDIDPNGKVGAFSIDLSICKKYGSLEDLPEI